ncbi:hypothetical protein ACEQ8H_007043 [Pleosporales sp. CAS-2024a]
MPENIEDKIRIDQMAKLVAKTKTLEQKPSPSPRADLAPSTSGPSIESNIENSAPTFTWYARPHPGPDSDTYEPVIPAKPQPTEMLLKPCLKGISKSAAATPSGDSEDLTDDKNVKRTIRRVKTVDFEKSMKPLLSLPPPPETTKKTAQKSSDDVRSLQHATLRPTKTALMAPSCPSMLSVAKSDLADTATTHADVHVIAIAPSRNVHNATNKADCDPATPTMQYVESNSGCYEVIWDNMPEQQTNQTRRRSSVASHSLQLTHPAAARGLQRVNSKLADWSGSWNALSDTFTPTIVVFPEHGTHQSQSECVVEDDEEMVALAPPNSYRTSPVPSRAPSQPPSAALTRVPSEELLPLIDALQVGPSEPIQGWVAPLAETLTVVDSDMQSTRLLNANQRLRAIPTIRKLSNIDGADLKFRGHRDSVTLAHSRLLHAGGLSPELFAHRDSVSIARKRMHAKNHSVSAAREAPVLKSSEYNSPLAMSLDDTVLDMPLVKQHVAQALRLQKSTSILVPQHQGEGRHIRIME